MAPDPDRVELLLACDPHGSRDPVSWTIGDRRLREDELSALRAMTAEDYAIVHDLAHIFGARCEHRDPTETTT